MNGEIIKEVANLKPGHSIEICSHDLVDEIMSYFYNGIFFHPADRLLESIAGSAYEFMYTENVSRDTTIFHRLKEPLKDV